MSKYDELVGCGESVSGLHDEGSRRDGRCIWCGIKYLNKAPRPKPPYDATALIDDAYDYHYDPDWDR